MLRDVEYKPSYSKGIDDIASEFYIPSLRQSVSYDRVTGYFSSMIYIIAWGAMKSFISNHGKMRLICSPFLSSEDKDAMEKGYSARKSEIIRSAIIREVHDIYDCTTPSAPYRLLAYMISEGVIDVKIATVGVNTTASVKRLFHDKVGVFYDGDRDFVGFRGSMNETYSGLAQDGNIESIDVFPSWTDVRDKERAGNAASQFSLLWANGLDGVEVLDFPIVARDILVQKSVDIRFEDLLDEIIDTEILAEKWCADKKKGAKRPRQHQVDALEKWVKQGKRGILEHATGSGKTYTAMCAIRSEIECGRSVLVLVPSVDLLNQWRDEIIENIAIKNLIVFSCGGGHTEWQKKNALRRWTQLHEKEHIITIATMDTAASSTFIQSVTCGSHLFIVADEVHRIGSKKRQGIFAIDCGARLALSATPKRYGDEQGTQAILDYFGPIIEPPFTLLDAINANVLTRYFYHPMVVHLSSSEQEEWDVLTKEICTLVARMNVKTTSEVLSSPKVKMKLIARARIIKNAETKIDAALSVVASNYSFGQKWIVYCDNQSQLRAVLNTLMQQGYDAYEYHSEMLGDRAQTLCYFNNRGGILVSIRCLDEGVDIPSTTHALILASSQNPREFIQRRGRILRKAPDKHYAHLFDVLTMPNMPMISDESEGKELGIVEGELARAIQFGEMAENPSCIAQLRNIAVDYGIDIDASKERGIEDGEE